MSGDASSSGSSKEVDIVEKINPITQMMRQLIKQQEKIIEHIEEIASKKEDNNNVGPQTAPSEEIEEQLTEHERTRRLKLYRAALRGDWEVAKGLYGVHKDDILVEISKTKDTALHIAATAKRTDFVKELLKRMKKDDLIKKNKNKRTALFHAASSGNVEIAEAIMKKNNDIAMAPDEYGTLPIEIAASLGHKEMVVYLYQETKHFLKEEHRNGLFISLIETDLYDVALELLNDHPDLAIARAANKGTALHVLARKHLTFSNLANQNHGGIFKGCLNFVSCAKDVQKKKQLAIQLVKLIWKRVILLSHKEISKLIAEPRKLMFDAAKRGNVEFLSILIRGCPDLIRKVDNAENKYSIFHYAVKYRQEDVFKLIDEIGTIKDFIVLLSDQNNNNVLHLAGMLPPQERLNIVSGAALQMQRELLWFQKVEKVVHPISVESTNNKGLTPRELFTEQHKDLRDNGEKWMKDTAQSCMVVATLITTVAFAAAFTVPGGNNGDTGFPFFLEKASFMVFAISDAISLVFSSASIIFFLSILTSRYAENDFLWVLPTKLHWGLITLLISIATMMIVFSATFLIVFKDKRLWTAILVTTIASTPVILFILLHCRLFCDVLCSNSDSLFQHSKDVLFRNEGEDAQNPKTKILDVNLKFQCSCSTNV